MSEMPDHLLPLLPENGGVLMAFMRRHRGEEDCGGEDLRRCVIGEYTDYRTMFLDWIRAIADADYVSRTYHTEIDLWVVPSRASGPQEEM